MEKKERARLISEAAADVLNTRIKVAWDGVAESTGLSWHGLASKATRRTQITRQEAKVIYDTYEKNIRELTSKMADLKLLMNPNYEPDNRN